MASNDPQPVGDKIEQNESKREDTKKSKKSRKRKSKQGSDLTCPMKILESVLSTANYKVPNLSEEVERKFYHTPDYSKELASLLEDVVYFPTVDEVNEYHSSVPISVFPLGFDGRVEVSEGAIMSMTCINAPMKRRIKRGKGKGIKGKEKSNNPKVVKNKNSETKEEEVIKEKVDDSNQEKQEVSSKNMVEKEEEEERVRIKQGETDMNKINVDTNEYLNGQASIETIAGNGIDEKKKKRRRKKQQQQNVDEKSET